MFNLANKIPTLSKNPDLITYSIKSDGKEISKKVKVISISVQKELNRIPVSKIILIDGDSSNQDFETSNEDFFIPGKEIEIKAGYHSEEETIFKGIATQHNLRVRSESSRLYIECRDEAFKTTIARKNRFFEETKDSDAIETILQEYRIKNDIATTKASHQELVQYNSTDWDFILSRADANAMVCRVSDGEITIEEPQVSKASVFDCSFGINVIEFDGEMDGSNQYDSAVAKSWDYSTQEITEVDGREPSYKGTGNLKVSDLAKKLNQPAYELYHSGNVKTEELQGWADSKLMHSRLSQVIGRVKVQGEPNILPGDMITLSGFGDRYNGEVYVSGIHHQISGGNWTTNIQFGFSKDWYHETYEISAPPASGLIPAIEGLQIGIVTQLEEDPEGEDRIKVRLPIVDAKAEGIWCRLSCLDAGVERGTFFRPEVDDEVIVGFVNSDPRDGVVLGMLHSSNKPTPEAITKENYKKGYISREKLKMEFDDEKKIITLETPGGNSLVMDEDAASITMKDQNGNKVILDSDGITIESAKDINLKASTGDVKIEGINVEISAQASFKAEGSASSEISSGGTTTVKGSIVQIN